MPVITIRGQMGSGASTVARACAKALHLDFVDREIINKVAEKLQRPREAVIEKEVLPTTLSKRIAKAIGRDFTRVGYSLTTGPGQDNPFLEDARYVRGLKSTIRELARSESIVISGRGSQFILKDMPNVLHVLLIAPLEVRLQRVMEITGLSKEEARKRITRYDKNRASFIKKYFKAELEDPIHYDLVINTERFTVESAVSLIVDAVYKRQRVINTI
jgi:cytidylate kinase